MRILSYSRARLLFLALLAALMTIFFVALFLNPASGAGGLRRLLASSFGSYVLVPFCIAVSAATTFRAIVTAFGDMSAIRSTPSGLVVTTLWRSTHIGWTDLGPMRFHRAGKSSDRTLELRDTSSSLFGNKYIMLALTDAHRIGNGQLFTTIDKLRSSPPVLASAGPAPILTGRSELPDLASVHEPLPVRPAFGRKRA